MERFHRSGGLKTQPNRFLDQLGGPLSETQLLHHGSDSETRHGNDPLPIKLSIAAEAEKQEVAPQVTRSHVTACRVSDWSKSTTRSVRDFVLAPLGWSSRYRTTTRLRA